MLGGDNTQVQIRPPTLDRSFPQTRTLYPPRRNDTARSDDPSFLSPQ